jgi:hypothetical protein
MEEGNENMERASGAEKNHEGRNNYWEKLDRLDEQARLLLERGKLNEGSEKLLKALNTELRNVDGFFDGELEKETLSSEDKLALTQVDNTIDHFLDKASDSLEENKYSSAASNLDFAFIELLKKRSLVEGNPIWERYKLMDLQNKDLIKKDLKKLDGESEEAIRPGAQYYELVSAKKPGSEQGNYHLYYWKNGRVFIETVDEYGVNALPGKDVFSITQSAASLEKAKEIISRDLETYRDKGMAVVRAVDAEKGGLVEVEPKDTLKKTLDEVAISLERHESAETAIEGEKLADFIGEGIVKNEQLLETEGIRLDLHDEDEKKGIEVNSTRYLTQINFVGHIQIRDKPEEASVIRRKFENLRWRPKEKAEASLRLILSSPEKDSVATRIGNEGLRVEGYDIRKARELVKPLEGDGLDRMVKAYLDSEMNARGVETDKMSLSVTEDGGLRVGFKKEFRGYSNAADKEEIKRLEEERLSRKPALSKEVIEEKRENEDLVEEGVETESVGKESVEVPIADMDEEWKKKLRRGNWYRGGIVHRMEVILDKQKKPVGFMLSWLDEEGVAYREYVDANGKPLKNGISFRLNFEGKSVEEFHEYIDDLIRGKNQEKDRLKQMAKIPLPEDQIGR